MTARKLFALPFAFAGGVILASFAGCTETNDTHCSVKGGDSYCQDKTGKAAGEVFCTNNCGGDYDFDGCLIASDAPAEGCWLCEGEGSQNCGSIGDGDGDATMTDTTADTSTTDATDTMSTTTAETTSGPECMMSSDCAAAEEPLCDAEACVGCGDAVAASCAADYPATPVCDAGSGACVECSEDDVSACSAEKPACEGGVCVPCSEHDQCMESACNMSTGACMPTDRVWWVNQSVAGPGTGTEADPYKEFTTALANIGDGESGVVFFATPDVHIGKVEVLGGTTVALVSKTDTGSILSNGVPTLDINQGATVFIGGIKAAGGNDYGFSCANCSAWINDSLIVKNSGAVQVNGGSVKIRNSFVGVSLTDVLVIDVPSGSVEIVYSTAIGNSGLSPAIQCGAGADVTIRNSLVASRDPGPEICAQADVSNSAIEMDIPGNTVIGPMVDNSWFVNFNEGNYHLSMVAPPGVQGAATWQTGDPKTDIDGNPRPMADGSPDYAGADIPN